MKATDVRAELTRLHAALMPPRIPLWMAVADWFFRPKRWRASLEKSPNSTAERIVCLAVVNTLLRMTADPECADSSGR